MLFSYLAPNPFPPKTDFLTRFFAGMSGSLSSVSRSESIGGVVLPAQGRRDIKVSDERIATLERECEVSIQRGEVETHDGAVLDTIEVKSSHEGAHRYIVKFNGNGGLYQDLLTEYVRDAKRLEATIIGFNYRGVGKSYPNPRAYQELVTDGIAEVRRLLDSGVPSTQIILDGHSLGGSVAVLVASYFHKRDLPMYVINDRSFSTLANAAAGIVKRIVPLPESSLASTSHVALTLTGWQVDVANAYKAIPAEYKCYMVVDKDSADGLGDGVISDRASMHQAVKEAETKKAEVTGGSFGLFFNEGHCKSRKALKNKSDLKKTAQDFVDEFVTTHVP
jgi:hypothetical protein